MNTTPEPICLDEIQSSLLSDLMIDNIIYETEHFNDILEDNDWSLEDHEIFNHLKILRGFPPTMKKQILDVVEPYLKNVTLIDCVK